MTFWTTLYNKDTWGELLEMQSPVAAFANLGNRFKDVKQDDILLCYASGTKAWVGALKIKSGRYHDLSVIHSSGYFPHRYRVEAIVRVPIEFAIPMVEFEGQLSFFPEGTSGKSWGCHVRQTLRRLTDEDGETIRERLISQSKLIPKTANSGTSRHSWSSR
jgi:hypothetical protein